MKTNGLQFYASLWIKHNSDEKEGDRVYTVYSSNYIKFKHMPSKHYLGIRKFLRKYSQNDKP